MRKSVQFAMAAALAFAVSGAGAIAGNIDDARLSAAGADASDWLLHGRDYTNQRFSPLDQINAASIKRLVPKWIYQHGASATFQTTPLIADGRMYVSAPGSHVIALDAKTGREIWRYDHKSKAKKLCCGPANRGVALGYGKVFVATVDARLIALDAATGGVVWDIPLAESDGGPTEDQQAINADDPSLKAKMTGSTGIGAAAAPLVYDGKVVIGVTGVGYGLHLEADRPGAPLGAVVGVAGRYGRPGFIAAYDANDGKKVWQFDTTQEGWEGSFSPTTPDGIKLPRDIAAEKAAAPKHTDAWKYGGGSVWHAPAYDPELGLLYVGIGNPSPQAAGETRPGDNLYSMSLVALDARSGKLKWHFQQVPHDLWGYDVASPPTLFDAQIDGKAVPAVGQASKLGWYYVHDRRDGKLLFKSEPFVEQKNMFTLPTREGVIITPGVAGGANWSPTSYNAAAGLVYVPAMHMPVRYRTEQIPATADKPAVTYYTMEPEKTEKNWGTLTAIDVNKGGKIAWRQKTNEPLIGGVVATAGGLVFTGEGGGDFSAFDAKTGEKLWSFNCGAGVNAPPVTYEIDGKQYIAVAAGGSQIWGFRQGGAVIVFGLVD
jgi:alcohol dehydrogenase (cytochrome c)